MMSLGRAWPRLLTAGVLTLLAGFLVHKLGWDGPSRLLRTGGGLLLVWGALDSRAAQLLPVLQDFVALGQKRAFPITRGLVALVAAVAAVVPWLSERAKHVLGTGLPVALGLIGAIALLEWARSVRSLSAREATIGGAAGVALLSAGTLLGAWGTEPTGSWWWAWFAALITGTVAGGIGWFHGRHAPWMTIRSRAQ